MGATSYPRIRAALPVGPVPTPPVEGGGDAATGDRVTDPGTLTRDLLTRAAERLGSSARVTGFRRWWDGDAWVPLLTVRIAGRPAWLVETGGELHVLPPRQRLARRALRRERPKPSAGALAPPGTRRYRSIAVGAPTRPGVEVLRGALTPRQVRERAAARRRALHGGAPPSGGQPQGGQLGLFGEADVETEPGPVTAPAAGPASAAVVVVVQRGDVVRCHRSGCGALVPLPEEGAGEEAPVCPLCSRR